MTIDSSASDPGSRERRENVPLGSVSLSSGVNCSSLGLTGLDVSHDSVVLELRVLRTLEGVGGERVSNLESSDLGSELLHEFVVDSLCRHVDVSELVQRRYEMNENEP